jgi:hypothetical protein
MDDKILNSSLSGNYTLTVNGTPVSPVTMSISASAQGNAILAFRQAASFPTGATIVFTLKKGVRDDGGNQMTADYVLPFTTASSAGGSAFDGNAGFESGSAGTAFLGDGAILAGSQGAVSPPEGSHFAAVTTGDALVSSGYAVNYTTSVLACGPINTPFSSLSFKADFASSEFNEFVGSEFDDTAIVIIYGPGGVKVLTITSVNLTGAGGNSDAGAFANLPDDGDDYAGHTGWKTYIVPNANVGTPAYLVFLVSDVADDIYSSALALDDLGFN